MISQKELGLCVCLTSSFLLQGSNDLRPRHARSPEVMHNIIDSLGLSKDRVGFLFFWISLFLFSLFDMAGVKK